jgi:hypothetical protein
VTRPRSAIRFVSALALTAAVTAACASPSWNAQAPTPERGQKVATADPAPNAPEPEPVLARP